MTVDQSILSDAVVIVLKTIFLLLALFLGMGILAKLNSLGVQAQAEGRNARHYAVALGAYFGGMVALFIWIRIMLDILFMGAGR